MIENNPINVSTAFEMLLEEAEAEIDFVKNVGAKAQKARNYGKAKEALERAARLTDLLDRVAGLRQEWNDLAATTDSQEDAETKAARRKVGRVRRGQRTPEEAYRRPILQVLMEMGGSGRMAAVLDRVGKIMKPILKDVDYGMLSSSPDLPRWRNAAQWARNSMVKEGLLKSDSPHGVWEIRDKGRQACPGKTDSPRVLIQGTPQRGIAVLGLLDDFTHRAPVAYSFLDKRHEVTKFKEILLALCTTLHERHGADFHKVLRLSGFSRNSLALGKTSNARQIARSGIYVATNRSAKDLMTKCRELLGLFGHRVSDFKVEVRAR